jgi:hypothetical protein
MMKNGVIVVALAGCISARAADTPQWVVTGLGNDSCASYVLALDDDRPTAAINMDGKDYYTAANAYTQWINGFVTAANMSGPQGFKYQIHVDVNGIALWVKNYCAAHPSDPIVSGAGAFVRTHRSSAK